MAWWVGEIFRKFFFIHFATNPFIEYYKKLKIFLMNTYPFDKIEDLYSFSEDIISSFNVIDDNSPLDIDFDFLQNNNSSNDDEIKSNNTGINSFDVDSNNLSNQESIYNDYLLGIISTNDEMFQQISCSSSSTINTPLNPIEIKSLNSNIDKNDLSSSITNMNCISTKDSTKLSNKKKNGCLCSFKYPEKIIISANASIIACFVCETAELVIRDDPNDLSPWKLSKRLYSDGYRFAMKFRNEKVSEILKNRNKDAFLKIHLFQNFFQTIDAKDSKIIDDLKTEKKKRVSNIEEKIKIEKNSYFTFSDLENSISCGEIMKNDFINEAQQQQQPNKSMFNFFFIFCLY